MAVLAQPMERKMDAFAEHRFHALEEQVAEFEGRIRALEIGYAKLIGWAAGGAFAGGLFFQLVNFMVK